MEIKKVILSRTKATIEYVDDQGNNITHKGEYMPHVDFTTAVASLIPHFAELTEQAEVVPFDADTLEAPSKEQMLQNLHVSGFTLKTTDNGTKVVIKGSRTLTTGKTLKLESPACGLEDGDYKQEQELNEAIDAVCMEAEAYFQGKHGDIVQKSLFDDNEDPFGDGPEATDSVE